LQDYLGSENDNEWMSYLKELKQMDDASGKEDLVEEWHQEITCLNL
jgi:hypothetical protein